MTSWIKAAGAILLLFLAGCGGGGGGSSGGGAIGVNRAPTAVAGPAQTVITGAVVAFDGRNSSDPDGNTITYAWTLTSKPAGSDATLTGATTAQPTFRADKDGAYAVSLTVSDGTLSSVVSNTTAMAASDPTDLNAARTAEFVATFDSSTVEVGLRWKDTFVPGTNYRIDMQTGTGAFTTLATVAGAAGGQLNWSRAYTGPASFRVTALTAGREVPALSPAGLAVLSVDPPTGLAIVADQSEPVTGEVNLSVASQPAGTTVLWFADLNSIGTANAVSWNTSTGVPNGSHLILARVDYGTGSFIDVRRSIATSNANIALAATTTKTGTSFALRITASTPLPATIANVQSRIDSGPFQTQTSKNGCSTASACSPNDAYVFTYDSIALGSGSHTYTVRATDSTGGVRQISGSFTIVNAPVLTITSPSVGAFVNGTLTISGTVTKYSSNTVTVTASLGAVQFLSTTASPFSGSFNLTGLPAGNYTLTVNAASTTPGESASEQRQVVVTSGSVAAPSRLFTVEADAIILAARDDFVLYRRANLQVVLRNVTTNTDLPLDPISELVGSYVIGDDGVYATGYAASNCERLSGQPQNCVYRWSLASGAMTNISNSDPAFVPSNRNARRTVRVRGRYVLWKNDEGAMSFTLYDSQTGSYTLIPQASGTASPNPNGLGRAVGDMYDFVMSGATPTLFFHTSESTGIILNSTTRLYRWTAATGAVEMLAENFTSQGTFGYSRLDSNFQTDGVTVSWSQRETQGGVGTNNPRVIPAAGGAAVKLASTTGGATNERLNSGVMGYFDGAQNRAWTVVGGEVQLGGAAGAVSAQNVGSGLFAYFKSPGVYTWNAATGTSTLRVEGGPFAMFITGGWMYFKSGDGVYRVALA